MFEKASKLKLRFSYKGLVSVEDLWDISLTELNTIAKGVNKELKDVAGEEDFISVPNSSSKARDILQLKLDILKHIIAVKMEQRDALKASKEKAERKQKILEIISKKQDADLENKSIEELKALLD